MQRPQQAGGNPVSHFATNTGKDEPRFSAKYDFSKGKLKFWLTFHRNINNNIVIEEVCTALLQGGLTYILTSCGLQSREKLG